MNNDDTLMREVRNGDLGKLSVLFDRHHRRLFEFFVRMTGNREVSEDLVQDVFFRILKYRNTFRPGSRFTTWMYHIARNVRIDHLHRHRNDYLVDDRFLEVVGPSIAPADLARSEQTELLRQALGRLDAEKREVLILSRFQNMKYDQIARVIGCQTATVKVRVFRAVQELRRAYFKITGERRSWTASK